MTKVIIKSILELLIILPLILLFLNKVKKNYKLIVLFFGFFIINEVMLNLPRKIDSFHFINGNWNWSGKVYAIVASVIFYFIFRKTFEKNDFLRLKQKKGTIRTNTIIIIIILIFQLVLNALFNGKIDLNFETLGFQFTMPGFDEELSFRVIMIGLLLTALKDKIIIGGKNFGNPSIWITGILFGLVHGFKLSDNWYISMDWNHFVFTFIFGLIWGWMAVKSRSFLMPLISHNLTNTLGTLINMIK